MKKKINCALICGGSYGLGIEITKYFTDQNLTTIVFSRDKKKLNQSIKKFKGKKVLGIKCDLSNPENVKKNLKKLKNDNYEINFLVCNAGNGKNDFQLNKNYLNYYNAYNKNFFTAINPIEILINLGNYKNLKIILISSIAGHFKGKAPLPYSLAKNSIINYARENAKFLATKKVLINSISPGHIMQPNNLWHKKLIKNKIKTMNFIKTNVALQKFCTTKDIISAIDFLMSEKNSYVTGTDMRIDGSSE